jgi:RimJ/RimL family protein N-acetyltransferase
MAQEKSYRLRRLEAKDLETVASFEREIAKVSFPDDPITDLRFYVKKLRHLLEDDDAAAFVAEDQTGLVGWAYVSKRQNFITKEPYADFHSIYVAPSQRGTGVVTELGAAVFDFCRRKKLGRVVFRTRANNERMKAVLARFGFVPTQIYYEKALDLTDDTVVSATADATRA